MQDVFNGCVEEGVILMQELVGIAWCAISPLALSREKVYCTMTKCQHQNKDGWIVQKSLATHHNTDPSTIALCRYETLTSYCTERFFTGSNFYTAKNIDKRISDIDQRLTKEIVDLSKEFPKMFASAVTPLFDVFWFSGRMMSLFGLRGMMPFYLYILATFVVSKFLMPDYVNATQPCAAISILLDEWRQ